VRRAAERNLFLKNPLKNLIKRTSAANTPRQPSDLLEHQPSPGECKDVEASLSGTLTAALNVALTLGRVFLLLAEEVVPGARESHDD